FSFVGDGTTRMLSLMSGQVASIERRAPGQAETPEAEAGIVIKRQGSVGNKYVRVSCSKTPLDNSLVRLAYRRAVVRDMIMEIMGSAGHASSNFVSPIKFGYTDLANYPKYDPEECQRLLAEAGYPNGEGLPELEYITSTGFYPKTKEYGEIITAL